MTTENETIEQIRKKKRFERVKQGGDGKT